MILSNIKAEVAALAICQRLTAVAAADRECELPVTIAEVYTSLGRNNLWSRPPKQQLGKPRAGKGTAKKYPEFDKKNGLIKDLKDRLNLEEVLPHRSPQR